MNFRVAATFLAAVSVSAAIASTTFVVDRSQNCVFRFDHKTGQYKGAFGQGFLGNGGAGGDIGPDGNLYVASFTQGQIFRFNPWTGQYLGTLASGFGQCIDVKTGPDGLLYVGYLSTTPQILRFNPTTGQYLGALGGGFLGSSTSAGNWLAFSGTDLLVTDATNGFVVRFDASTGQYKGTFGGGFLSTPTGITVYDTNRVLVMNYGSGNVMRFDPTTGQYLGIFASGFLSQPFGIATLSDGRIVAHSKLYGSSYLGESMIRFDPSNGRYEGHYGLGFLGTVTGGLIAAKPATISGTINLAGYGGDYTMWTATFELYEAGQTTPTETQTVPLSATGAYSVQFYTRGAVKITAKAHSWLAKAALVTIERDPLSQNFTLQPGDTDNDNDVDIDDYDVLANAYGSFLGDPTYDVNADLDGDGDVDIDDYDLLAFNYGDFGD